MGTYSWLSRHGEKNSSDAHILAYEGTLFVRFVQVASALQISGTLQVFNFSDGPLNECAKRLNPKAQTPVSQKLSNPADLQLFSRQHEKDSSPKQMA